MKECPHIPTKLSGIFAVTKRSRKQTKKNPIKLSDLANTPVSGTRCLGLIWVLSSWHKLSHNPSLCCNVFVCDQHLYCCCAAIISSNELTGDHPAIRTNLAPEEVKRTTPRSLVHSRDSDSSGGLGDGAPEGNGRSPSLGWRRTTVGITSPVRCLKPVRPSNTHLYE